MRISDPSAIEARLRRNLLAAMAAHRVGCLIAPRSTQARIDLVQEPADICGFKSPSVSCAPPECLTNLARMFHE